MKWSDISVKARIISGGVIGLVAAMAVGTAGCSEPEKSASETYKINTFAEDFFEVKEFAVRLRPKNDGTLGVNVEKGDKCEEDQNPHDGCMRFMSGIEGRITFYISGTGNQIRNCSEAKYVITSLELTATGELDKGVFNSGRGLPGWLKHQAFTNLDLQTGIVSGDSGGEPSTQLIVKNLNRHTVNPEKLQFWYKVTVADCEDPERRWVTDPRGDNEG